MENTKKVNAVNTANTERSLTYQNQKGITVSTHNGIALKISDDIQQAFSLALTAENATTAVETLGAFKCVQDSETEARLCYVLRQIQTQPKFWEKEKFIKADDFIKYAQALLGERQDDGTYKPANRSLVYKKLKRADLINPDTLKDNIRDKDNLTFSELSIFDNNFTIKDDNDKSGGKLDIEKIKKALLHTKARYDVDTGEKTDEFIIRSTMLKAEKMDALKKYGYLPATDTKDDTKAESDKNTAKTGESNVKGENTNGNEKGAESGKKAVKKPLSLQELYKAIAVLCNENGTTIGAIVKYHESINK